MIRAYLYVWEQEYDIPYDNIMYETRGTLSNQQQIDSTGHRSINLVKEGPFDRIRCIPDRYGNILLAHLKMACQSPQTFKYRR